MTIFLGVTRLVVQAGMHYLTTPMSAQGMVDGSRLARGLGRRIWWRWR